MINSIKKSDKLLFVNIFSFSFLPITIMSLVKTKGKALVFATHVSRLAGYSLPHDHEMCVKFKETDEGEIELTFRGSKRKLELLSFPYNICNRLSGQKVYIFINAGYAKGLTVWGCKRHSWNVDKGIKYTGNCSIDDANVINGAAEAERQKSIEHVLSGN